MKEQSLMMVCMPYNKRLKQEENEQAQDTDIHTHTDTHTRRQINDRKKRR